MANIKNDQKKNLARDLYVLGTYTLEEIASKVDSTRQTISKWAKEQSWEELKAGMSISREELLKNLYRQVSDINESINMREPGERHANVKEADTLAKLSSAIKKLESDVGISDIVAVGIRFTNWLRNVDLDKAKEFTMIWDAFLKEQF